MQVRLDEMTNQQFILWLRACLGLGEEGETNYVSFWMERSLTSPTMKPKMIREEMYTSPE
jgi:hypothetical protein